MIKISKLSCIKNDQIILRDINIDITKGEKIAIIGPSGAGKTTLFNILSKLEENFDGSVVMDSKNIHDYNNNRIYAKIVGVISQGVNLIENLKVIHNVSMGHLSSWSFLQSLIIFFKKDKAALDALNSVSMAAHQDKKTSQLSGGEKQRVAIARLLVQNPKIILADEPIAALDPKLAKDAVENLVHHTKGKTLVMILHHTSFAIKYFDRIIALKKGRLVFDLPSENVTDEMLGELYE